MNKQKNGEENEKIRIGSLRAIMDIVKRLVQNIKNFNLKESIENSQKEDYMAAGITLAIVIILGIVLWCIPFTRGFIRSLIPF